MQPSVKFEDISNSAFWLVAFAVGGEAAPGKAEGSREGGRDLSEQSLLGLGLGLVMAWWSEVAVESSVQQQRSAPTACYIFRAWRCLKCGFSSGHSLYPLIAAHTCTHTQKDHHPLKIHGPGFNWH